MIECLLNSTGRTLIFLIVECNGWRAALVPRTPRKTVILELFCRASVLDVPSKLLVEVVVDIKHSSKQKMVTTQLSKSLVEKQILYLCGVPPELIIYIIGRRFEHPNKMALLSQVVDPRTPERVTGAREEVSLVGWRDEPICLPF